MTHLACPTCRLLQPASPTCQGCGQGKPVALQNLTTTVIRTSRSRRPPESQARRASRWNRVVLGGFFFILSYGFFGPGIALVVAATVLLVSLPPRKWQRMLSDHQQLLLAAPAFRPRGEAFLGVAEKLEQCVEEPGPPVPSATVIPTGASPSASPGASPDAPLRPVLLVETALVADAGILLRELEAVPFWLVQEDRRLLVTGAITTSAELEDSRVAVEYFLRKRKITVEISTELRQQLRLRRLVLRHGDRITVTGALTSENRPDLRPLAAASGYRDTFISVLRGEPAEPLWIEAQQLEAQ